MEGIVLLMVVLAPWFFGAVDPLFEYALFGCIALLALLWGVRSVVERQFLWFACPIVLCLGLIFLSGILQLVPMPSWLLHVASPAAARLNSELRPNQLEVITEGSPPTATTPWPTISVYPIVTQQWLARLLAVIVLFAAVRVNIASTDSLKRFAWAAFITGVALAIHALYQFVYARAKGGDESQKIFGYLTRGQVFGTFICRNHFAYYINICIGLGLGLLLISGRTDSEKRAQRTHKAQALVEQTAEGESTLSLLSILHSPLQVWLSVGIAIMVGAIVCSMSRGGVAALVGGIILAVIMRGVPKVRRVARLDLIIVPLLLVGGLILWIGIKPLESRLAMGSSDLTSDGRLVMWKNLMSLAWRFPVFGSGNGTLQYVEPLTRAKDIEGYNAAVDIDHAHNDYLEGLVEGGILRLGLMLAVVALLFLYGRQAMRRHETRTPGRLAFGALAGIAAVALHSFVDFGLSTPAVTCLATVTAAYLASMARSDPSDPLTARSKNAVIISLRGWGGIVAAVAFVFVGLILLRAGSVAAKVNEFRLAAAKDMKAQSPELAAKSLLKAIDKSPADARTHDELGQIYLDWYRLETRKIDRARSTAAAFLTTGISPFEVAIAHGIWSELQNNGPKRREFDKYIKPALFHMIVARDLCPLLARPQARLSLYANDAHPEIGITMSKSDPAIRYCERAALLAPFDPDILYTLGLMQFQAGQFDAAWTTWRKSLSLKPTHLRSIVTAALPKLGPEAFSDKLLPDDPAVMLEAARVLSDRPEMSESIKLILERAKKALIEGTVGGDANAARLLGQCHRMLGESDSAISAYRRAVDLAPSRLDWQYEFAEYLYSLRTENERIEAKKILGDIIAASPNHSRAINLLAIIERDGPKR